MEDPSTFVALGKRNSSDQEKPAKKPRSKKLDGKSDVKSDVKDVESKKQKPDRASQYAAFLTLVESFLSNKYIKDTYIGRKASEALTILSGKLQEVDETDESSTNEKCKQVDAFIIDTKIYIFTNILGFKAGQFFQKYHPNIFNFISWLKVYEKNKLDEYYFILPDDRVYMLNKELFSTNLPTDQDIWYMMESKSIFAAVSTCIACKNPMGLYNGVEKNLILKTYHKNDFEAKLYRKKCFGCEPSISSVVVAN